MRIGVIGTGAIGGYFGSKLLEAGFDVTFIDVGKTLESIKAKGITINSFIKDIRIEKPNITDDLTVLRDKDLIILSVKSYDTKEVAKKLKCIISDNAHIISMQNGVDNEDILAEILGAEKVIGSAVYLSCNVPEPGIINHTALNRLILGRIDNKDNSTLEKIKEAFEKTGLVIEISSDIKKELWQKLMINIPFNGFTALINGPLEKYAEVPEASESFFEAMKEVQRIAQAEGINVTDKDTQKTFESFTSSKGFDKTLSSTLQDMQAGRKLEIDSFQGTIIRLAQKHNIKVPINKILYALLMMRVMAST